jgi:hypothetical protein
METMTIIKTKSGSVYELDTDAKTILRVSGGGHYAGRACGKPCKYEEIHGPEIGSCLRIVWGSGRDEFSPDDGHDDEGRLRMTTTSPVVEIY